MSKMDALRAMREARYAAQAPARTPARPAPAKPAAATPKEAAAAPKVGACGHKAIGGRTCTRDAGHSEKSHRYS